MPAVLGLGVRLAVTGVPPTLCSPLCSKNAHTKTPSLITDFRIYVAKQGYKKGISTCSLFFIEQGTIFL
jgi:hypothetical protein